MSQKENWFIHLSSLSSHLFFCHVAWQHWIEKLVNLQASLQTGIIIIIIIYSYSYVMCFWSQIFAFYFLQFINVWISVMMVLFHNTECSNKGNKLKSWLLLLLLSLIKSIIKSFSLRLHRFSLWDCHRVSLFIKSQYTVFLFCTSYCFLHILLLLFFLHILFAHPIVFCTSYCFFAHLIVLHFFFFFFFHCTFYSYFSFSYHMYALVLCYFI